jgi:hypothetical protein
MNDVEKLTEHLKEIKGLGFVPSGNIKRGQDSKTNALFRALLSVHNDTTQTVAEIFFVDGKPKISLRINDAKDLETLAKLSIEQNFEYAIREEKNDD